MFGFSEVPNLERTCDYHMSKERNLILTQEMTLQSATKTTKCFVAPIFILSVITVLKVFSHSIIFRTGMSSGI